MPTCPECGTEQADGRFCGNCGSALPAGRVHDEPPEPAWEDRERPRRRWPIAAGTVLAALIAIALAALGSAGPSDTVADAPAAPSATTQPTPPASDAPTPPETPDAPPRPETQNLRCPNYLPACATWRTDFPGVAALTDPTLGRDERHVFVGASLRDGTGAIYAIDPTNGIQLWRRRLPGPARRPALAPVGTVAVVYDSPSGGTGVRTFDPETGEPQLRIERALRQRATADPAVAGTVLAVPGPDQLQLRSLTDGTATTVRQGWTPTALVAADDDAVFLVVTAGEEVLAVDRRGAALWRIPGPTVVSDVDAGRAVAMARSGTVIGVDVREGRRWRTEVGTPDVPPIVGEGEVVVFPRSGELVRLSLEDGQELGRYAWNGQLGGPVTRHADTLYAPLCAAVVAADVPDGRRRWTVGLDVPEGTCAGQPVVVADTRNVVVSAGTRLLGVIG